MSDDPKLTEQIREIWDFWIYQAAVQQKCSIAEIERRLESGVDHMLADAFGGVGRALLAELIVRCEALGCAVIVSVRDSQVMAGTGQPDHSSGIAKPLLRAA